VKINHKEDIMILIPLIVLLLIIVSSGITNSTGYERSSLLQSFDTRTIRDFGVLGKQMELDNKELDIRSEALELSLEGTRASTQMAKYTLANTLENLTASQPLRERELKLKQRRLDLEEKKLDLEERELELKLIELSEKIKGG